MNVKRIFVLAYKDVIDAVRTPRLLIIVITPLLMSLAIQVFFGNKLILSIGVYTPDTSEMISILKQVDLVRVKEFETPDDLKTAVQDKDVAIGAILPANFDLSLRENGFASIEIFLADNSPENQVGISLLQQAISTLSPSSFPVQFSVQVLQPEISPGISLRGNLGLTEYAVVLWLVMGIVGNSVMLVPTLIVEEKDKKTLEALLLSPASYSDIVAAKAAVGVFYSLTTSSLILVLQGNFSNNFAILFMLILLGSFSLNILGVLLGSLSPNLHILNSYGSLFVFILALPAFVGMLGPHPLLPYLQILPTFPLTDGISRIFESGSAASVTRPVLLLSSQMFLTFSVVVFLLKHRYLK